MNLKVWKQEKSIFLQQFSFHEQLQYMLNWVEYEKSVWVCVCVCVCVCGGGGGGGGNLEAKFDAF